MTYIPNAWATGDVVTAEKLNHMEEGIASNASNIFVVTFTRNGATPTADASLTEIYNAFQAGAVVIGIMNVGDASIPSYAVYSLTNAASDWLQFITFYFEPGDTTATVIDYATDHISETSYVITTTAD